MGREMRLLGSFVRWDKGMCHSIERSSWLLADGFEGAFSVEWEYAWHPELDPPEAALPAALRTVRELLAAAQEESR